MRYLFLGLKLAVLSFPLLLAAQTASWSALNLLLGGVEAR